LVKKVTEAGTPQKRQGVKIAEKGREEIGQSIGRVGSGKLATRRTKWGRFGGGHNLKKKKKQLKTHALSGKNNSKKKQKHEHYGSGSATTKT